LDSDDEWDSAWVRTMLAAAEGDDVGLVSCAMVDVRPDDRVGAYRRPASMGPAFGGVVANFRAGAMLIRREVFEAAGGYDERYWYGENTELGLRLAAVCVARRWRVLSVSDPLYRWHDRAGRSSYDPARLAAAELMLVEHAAELSRDRALWADHVAVAGVCAARLGRWSQARGHFAHLVRRHPTPTNVGRLVAAALPVLGRRVWVTP
jgi:hypothetical protein